MSPIANGRILFNEIPEGFPEVGKTVVLDTSQTINPDTVALNGGILIKVLYLSVDPYMRGRMRHASKKSYTPPYTIGQPITSLGVGIVLRSEHSDVKVGDHISGLFPHQHYFVAPNTEELGVIEHLNPAKLPWSTFIGVLGMPGKTSYYAWKEYSHAKKGETAFVTTAAGPVGSLVVQLAKEDGLKVIASAGSDEKVEFAKALGADVAFNYKTTNTREVLQKEGPIDVFWDNVGGEILEAALDEANNFARFIECGMISGYNSGGVPVRNLIQVISKSITLSGFIVTRLDEKYRKEFYEVVGPKVASGEIKFKEHVFEGLESVGEAIVAVQKGTNKAKAVVHVADE